MAIYEVPTLEKAVEIMDAAYLHFAEYHPIVFDLNESLDPNDVEVSISQCLECTTVARFKLGDDNEGVCPKCSQPMKELVVVSLIIQGSAVISTAWREP